MKHSSLAIALILVSALFLENVHSARVPSHSQHDRTLQSHAQNHSHKRHTALHEVAHEVNPTQLGTTWSAGTEQSLHEPSSRHAAASSQLDKSIPDQSNQAHTESTVPDHSPAHAQSEGVMDHSHHEAKSASSEGDAENLFSDSHVTAWSEIPKDPYTWDGEPSWEWDNPRTLYFEPLAGLGNRLRALASAVVLAKEYGVGLKVIWRAEKGCKECFNPGFNSTWPDLFEEPRLRLVENFPGSTYDSQEERIFLRAEDRDELSPPILDHQCAIWYPRSHQDMLHAMKTGWKKIGAEDVLCVSSDLWLTEAGEKEGKFFFRLLKPSPMVQSMMDKFKYETEWEENHMVGVHVRRGDLTIWGKNGSHDAVKSLIPIEGYINAMKAQKQLAAGIKRVRFFLATDDAEAEAEIKAAFKPGYVFSYEKVSRSRLSVQGIQEALADVMLLADCPVLIGTYYSSYSETAKMMGWPFYIQIGHDLKSRTVETKFDKDDPDEEEERR